MRGKIFGIVIAVFCFTGMLTRADDEGLDIIKIRRVPYVTVDSFCKKYSLNPPKQIENNVFEIQSPSGKKKLYLKVDSRECRYNGILYWMSLPVLEDDEKALISKVDILKLFSPLLHPKDVGPKMLVLGVIIDPGHGGSNLGTVSKDGLAEKDANLAVARLLRAELKREGIPCVMTRDSDKEISLEDRASFTKRYPAYLFVSIHHNEGNTSSKGVETFCLTPESASSTNDGGYIRIKSSRFSTGNYFDSTNLLLASYVHREMMKLRESSDEDRGVKRARFGVLRRARAPAILLEVGFMSNREDLKLIKSQQHRENVVEKMTTAIKRFMSVMNKSQIPPKKLRRPMDRGLEFVSSPLPPLRKAEFVKNEVQQTIKQDVKLASGDGPKLSPDTAQLAAVEEKGKIDPHEPEDGRGMKGSDPSDDIHAILESKVQDILKDEKKVDQKRPVTGTPQDIHEKAPAS